MKFTYRDFWKKFWALVDSKSGELNIEKLSADWQRASTNEKPGAYREVKIGKMLYCLTSIFEGKKDLDKTVEQIAIRRAANMPIVEKEA